MDKTGGTFTGDVSFRHHDWSGISLVNTSGRYSRIETNPNSSDYMLSVIYRETNGSNINIATLRKRNGELAFKDEINWGVLAGKP
jgi:hypothetical protein|uniref:Uncharacterized protein n=1 Tax=Myoviridae sp. ctCo31 TaxID=2825053 RepID=A0A8S5UMF0_9CAUD|nr:MAG TPA: hypothetical protein [Myoviridae sp. ctCo31]